MLAIRRSDAYLFAECRPSGTRREAVRTSIAFVVVGIVCTAFWSGMNWLLLGDPSIRLTDAFSSVSGARALGMLTVLFVAPVVVFAAMKTREVISIAGRQLTYERYRGTRRVAFEEYDLLDMRAVTTRVPAVLTTANIPTTAILFWHREAPASIGDILDPDERNRLAAELIDYDRALRASIGLDPEGGLADIGYWAKTDAKQRGLSGLYSRRGL